MRVTEQIDAMEVSAVKPFKFLVSTRIGAATAMLPMLMVIGLVGVALASATRFFIRPPRSGGP